MITTWLTQKPVAIDMKLINRGRSLKEMRDDSEAFDWFKKLIHEKVQTYHEAMVARLLPGTESLQNLQGKVVALREILEELDDEIESGEKEAIKFMESTRK